MLERARESKRKRERDKYNTSERETERLERYI